MAHVIKQRPEQNKTREPSAEPLCEYRASDRLRHESLRFVFAPENESGRTNHQNRRAVPHEADKIRRADNPCHRSAQNRERGERLRVDSSVMRHRFAVHEQVFFFFFFQRFSRGGCVGVKVFEITIRVMRAPSRRVLSRGGHVTFRRRLRRFSKLCLGKNKRERQREGNTQNKKDIHTRNAETTLKGIIWGGRQVMNGNLPLSLSVRVEKP